MLSCSFRADVETYHHGRFIRFCYMTLRLFDQNVVWYWKELEWNELTSFYIRLLTQNISCTVPKRLLPGLSSPNNYQDVNVLRRSVLPLFWQKSECGAEKTKQELLLLLPTDNDWGNVQTSLFFLDNEFSSHIQRVGNFNLLISNLKLYMLATSLSFILKICFYHRPTCEEKRGCVSLNTAMLASWLLTVGRCVYVLEKMDLLAQLQLRRHVGPTQVLS